MMGIPILLSNVMEVFKDSMKMGMGGKVGCKLDWRELRVGDEKIQTMNLENSTQNCHWK